MRYLVGKGANVTGSTTLKLDSETIYVRLARLGFAVYEKHTECVKFLLEAGADVNQPAADEANAWTLETHSLKQPTLYAEYGGQVVEAKLLLETKGADHLKLPLVNGWAFLVLCLRPPLQMAMC